MAPESIAHEASWAIDSESIQARGIIVNYGENLSDEGKTVLTVSKKILPSTCFQFLAYI